jgi:hypothetical protein
MTATDLLSSAVVGAIAGGAASLVNGWLQRKSAKEMVRISLITPMREAWVGRLREKLAGLMGMCGKLRVRMNPEDGSTPSAAVLRYEIALMLDQRQSDHVDLYRAIENLLKVTFAEHQTEEKSDKDFTAAIDQVRLLAHDILRSEWQRAKAGE